MTGPEGIQITYTLDLQTNPVEGEVKASGRFRFSLTIKGNDITGVVEELSVPVTGTNHVIGGELDVHRMILEFLWAPSIISLEGFTYGETGERREFVGKFDAIANNTRAAGTDEGGVQLFQGPDPGDTGTGTGQQT